MSNPIDPSKATPQAPRMLRVGSKGYARAMAAAAAGKPAPDAANDDDDDEDDDEEEEDEAYDAAALPSGEADKDELGKCADACEAAAEACSTAAEQLTAQAKELRAGTDSISSLQATEAACQAADEALDEASGACAGLRGAEPPADPDSVPPPPADESTPGAPGMLAAPGTTEAHLERAQLAAFGLHVLGKLKLSVADVVKAKGILGARLDLAATAEVAVKREAKTKAQADTARREKLWEDAVRDRRVQMAQAFARVDGPDGNPQRVYAEWATKQNAAYPEIEAFEAWISSRVPEPGNASAEPSTVLADIAADKHAAFKLSERDKAEAKRAGIDPEALARQLATTQKGAQRADERI